MYVCMYIYICIYVCIYVYIYKTLKPFTVNVKVYK